MPLVWQMPGSSLRRGAQSLLGASRWATSPLLGLSALHLRRSQDSRRAQTGAPMTDIDQPRDGAAQQTDEDARTSTTVRDISRAMVTIYKEQFGRGPETVWTRYCGPDA